MAEIITVDPASPQSDQIARAAGLVRQGEVIAFATDTLYGLAADPFNAAAVERVFAIKERPADAPLLLLVDSVEMVASCASRLTREVDDRFRRLAERFWPGPLTIVVDASSRLAPGVTAGTGRIGLRLPAAPIPLALVRAVEGPVTATSANRSGMPACRTAAEVQSQLGDRLPLIVDGGESTLSQPSTVIGLRAAGWELIREGAIPRAELEKFLGRDTL